MTEKYSLLPPEIHAVVEGIRLAYDFRIDSVIILNVDECHHWNSLDYLTVYDTEQDISYHQHG